MSLEEKLSLESVLVRDETRFNTVKETSSICKYYFNDASSQVLVDGPNKSSNVNAPTYIYANTTGK